MSHRPIGSCNILLVISYKHISYYIIYLESLAVFFFRLNPSTLKFQGHSEKKTSQLFKKGLGATGLEP